ncbi:LemA protein [Dokdonia sp. Hel_I_63]|jgi:LemA protein|uniref:LemA family protein n=1 Tax=unclassified Dokdonia TaxID=2615033 RepID=UPI00020A6BC2|nr:MULTISPECIES: LemA family protein [unclassified Dokdonia]AEE19588.1 LemA family protein [Dokdonia sp. 4H-3-7-5]AWH73334.1 LemA family protein [Dokdonia sp. Dokd-P16]TVZ21184.1 LemA protein [Dokdonia sp. Hel_I_63]
MKKGLIALIAIVAILVIGGLWLARTNNNLVPLDEEVSAQWGNVESSYQRRADLIPNIVNTAKGYAEFEQSTLIGVIEARSKATSINIDPSNITPAQLRQFQEAQSGLTSALSRLLAVFERYPDLKANENFKELINELERTENRINVERNRFNEKAKILNSEIRMFPTNLAAGILGFENRAYFEADAGSENAPEVEFDFGTK